MITKDNLSLWSSRNVPILQSALQVPSFPINSCQYVVVYQAAFHEVFIVHGTRIQWNCDSVLSLKVYNAQEDHLCKSQLWLGVVKFLDIKCHPGLFQLRAFWSVHLFLGRSTFLLLVGVCNARVIFVLNTENNTSGRAATGGVPLAGQGKGQASEEAKHSAGLKKRLA